jgi:uncharacterized protein DUF928
MKHFVVISLLGGILCFASPGIGPDMPVRAAMAVQDARATSVPALPIYKPRKENAPRGRIDGESRGGLAGDMVLRVLAPDHVGFTVKGEPTLYWYLSKATAVPVEFTLVDTRKIPPVVEKTLSAPAQSGVQKIVLKELGQALEPGVEYYWSISLITDPDSRSQDIMARGTIERIPFDEALMLDLVRSCTRDIVYLYAERGVWYDAIGCVMELLDRSPNDDGLQRLLFSLLNQGRLILPYDSPVVRDQPVWQLLDQRLSAGPLDSRGAQSSR